MDGIFAWAQSSAAKFADGQPLTHIILKAMDRYIEREGSYVSLYVSETDDALLCVHYRSGRGCGVAWCRLMNLAQVRKEAPESIDRLRRHGEYVYAFVTGGEKPRLVDMESLRYWARSAA